jgi:uncharacterized protein YbaP (TraB family)
MAPIGAFLALVTGAVLLPTAPAQDAAPTARSGAQGLLWKVDGKGYPPSYVFGTIHVADPRVTRLPPAVRGTFDAAAHLVVEMVPDAAALGELALSMQFSDDRSLRQTVGAETFTNVRAALARRRMPLPDLDSYKPWAITLILSMPNPGDGVPLDLALQLRAAKRGQTVDGLETMAEQIAVFNDMSLDDQVTLLEATLREQTEIDDRIEALVQAYLARDLGKLQALAEAEQLGDRTLTRTVMRRLLTDRNRRMVARMQSWLRRGNAFVAVGAAHLPGPEGILALLERAGYRVSAVY